MQTPPNTATKGGRKQGNKHKPKDMSQRSVQSDNDAYHLSNQKGDQTPSKGNKGRPRRKSQAQKQGGAQSEAGEYSDGVPYKPSERAKATPIKQQAYAGPTFHQSPAASALPLPSFYSRSVPSTSMINSIAEASDTQYNSESNEQLPTFPSTTSRKEGTPLDFLFDAARKAQSTPKQNQSQPHLLSPPHGSPASRSPAPRDGDVDFPFELDVPENNQKDTVSAYPTPFKDRLEAARSPHPTPGSSPALTEEQRRAKTEALKKALLPPQGPFSPPTSTSTINQGQLQDAFNDMNPFNARSVTHGQQHPRYVHANQSLPSSNMNGYASNPNPQFFAPRQYSPNRSSQSNPHNRPPSSGLRNMYDPEPAELSSDSTTNNGGVSTGRRISTTPQPNFAAIYGGPKPSTPPNNTVGGSNNMQQGLDDLRKILNLDLMGRG